MKFFGVFVGTALMCISWVSAQAPTMGGPPKPPTVAPVASTPTLSPKPSPAPGAGDDAPTPPPGGDAPTPPPGADVPTPAPTTRQPTTGGDAPPGNNVSSYPPFVRFHVYSALPDGLKIYVDALNYTEEGWNTFDSEVEQLLYEDLSEDQQSNVTWLNITEPQWNCWINHYEGAEWEYLATLNVQEYFAVLGWDESSWTNLTAAPDSESKAWAELTADEQSAAEEVCYSEETWDEIALTEFGTGSPSSEETPAPSPVPVSRPSAPTAVPVGGSGPTATIPTAPTPSPVSVTGPTNKLPTVSPTKAPTKVPTNAPKKDPAPSAGWKRRTDMLEVAALTAAALALV